jgi:tRNA threonylcarbamoyladenosine modification (KEOPS) complex  Pcc1 subunit
MNEVQDFDATFAGTEEERRDKSSEPILREIRKAQKDFRDWQDTCQLIDDVYSRYGATWDSLHKLYGGTTAWNDNDLDLFWASMEVLKPAVYARAPKPAVRPLFSDADLTKTKTAELLERVSTSALMATDINDIMYGVRDDLLFTNRGVIWVRYESKGGQRVCVEHLDRRDFLHETARKWAHVGWVAGGFWMSPKEMKDRFVGKNGITEEALEGAKFVKRRDDQTNGNDNAVPAKCQVWEVWHKADNKVYWVTEGIGVLLDSGDPHLKLKGFFPCPRPAYGTLQRRSLIPVPDWDRYAIHFRKISDLTGRIYRLLDDVRMKGLIPAGGDAGDAVEQLIRSDDDRLLIPVPAAALLAQGGNFVIWLPLAELATAIQGLIEARGQLIQDFYQLSGISDIMRGATEAEETLGAQQLKSQYGSVRVRDKIDELQRIAADTVGIIAEIAAEKFSKDTLLDMAQMTIPTKRELDKRVKEIEDAAEEELKGLEKKAREQVEQQSQNLAASAPNGGGGASPPPNVPDPAQARAMLQQAQQAILQKWGAQLEEVQQQVPVEDVMKLLRDDKARSFAFEVESDSTIMTDELQEKASRNEFLDRFTSASQSLTGLMAMGEQGAKLAGETLKFVLAPYRAGRQLDGAIDAFIEAAPEMAAKAAAQAGEAGEGAEELAKANQTLADAEMQKARAATAGVEAKAALDKAEMQRKMLEMQQKAQEATFKAEAEAEKLRQSLSAEQAKTALIEAQVNKLTAETAAILNKIGLDVRAQELSEYQAAANEQARVVDQSMQAENAAADQEFRARGEDRSDRQQDFSEQAGDRQMSLAEQQAQQEPGQ